MKPTNTPILAPVAEKIPHVMSEHGVKRVDNYYWMNERDSPKVIQYLNDENSFTEQSTADLKPLEETLFQEFKKRIKEDDQSLPYKKNGYWYYSRHETGKEYAIYCRKKGTLEANEEIMFNVNEMAEGYAYYEMFISAISDDQNLVAFAVDTVSRRQYTIYIKNLTTGEILPTEIKNTCGDAVWAADNQTLFYTVKDKALRVYKVFRHSILDTNTKNDVLIFHEKNARFSIDIDKSKSDKYLFISTESTLSSEVWYLEADKPFDDFKLFHKRTPKLEYGIEHWGDYFLVLCNWNAPNFRLMKTPINNTAKEHWQDVIPANPEVKIEDIEIYNNFLVVEERKQGLTFLRVINIQTKESHYIDFGEPTYAAGIGDNLDMQSDLLRFGYTSLTTPRSTFEYNMLTQEKKLLKQQEVPDADFSPNNYETLRLWAPAEDGKQVPMSIVYKKGLELNGNNPTLLYAYGSYGYSMDPYFSVARLSLLDRGFVYVLAHIRGGEELGREWYEDGKFLKKKNTFTDFIACAEYIVQQKYTSPAKLAIMGGSAGGMLMGVVANMRPDLFNVIVAEVPFVDVVTTMLDESLPLTVGEYEEWGDPHDPQFFEYMLSYSPYDNVKAQHYPHLLVTSGYHDSQVQYWEPAKWVAKLRDMKTDHNTLLLKTEMDFGHGGASGRFQQLKETAFEYAFIIEKVMTTI